MTYRNYLKQGLQVELNVIEGDYEGSYRSLIEEINEDLVTVGAPIEGGQVIPIREGTKVFLVLSDESAAYEIQTKVIKRQAEPIPMFILALSDSFRRVQRRNFVRVPVFYEFTYRAITREGLSSAKKATMFDLSGGGMRFQTKEKLSKDTILFAELSLHNVEMMVQAKVQRVLELEEKGHYSISVAFVDLSERDRDRIINCVFDIQRGLRKKGLV